MRYFLKNFYEFLDNNRRTIVTINLWDFKCCYFFVLSTVTIMNCPGNSNSKIKVRNTIKFNFLATHVYSKGNLWKLENKSEVNRTLGSTSVKCHIIELGIPYFEFKFRRYRNAFVIR